jgi:hypothetical protein
LYYSDKLLQFAGDTMEELNEEIGKFLKEYVDASSISFLREDPYGFASKLQRLFSILHISQQENSLDALKTKTLFCLWNNILDDLIEYTDKGKQNVLESLQICMLLRKGKDSIVRTETGQIMHDFIQHFYKLSFGPNKEISEELLFLDLVRMINGFDYERIVHENDTIGTLPEYMEFATATVDLRIMLDIDIAIFSRSLKLQTIGDLRQAYKFFDYSLRLSSDIASFKREYYVEKSQNSVILYGQEKKKLQRNILQANKAEKEKMFKNVIPSLMDKIKEKAEKYLTKSLTCLNRIEEIETDHISKAFKSMLEEYPWYDDFSPPPK